MFDRERRQVVSMLQGHTKKVTDVTFNTAGTLLSTSADRTVRVWGPQAVCCCPCWRRSV